MDKKEILLKAFRKAIRNGWVFIDEKKDKRIVISVHIDDWHHTRYVGQHEKGSAETQELFRGESERLILSHEFSKAFWGEGNCTILEGFELRGKKRIPSFQTGEVWQAHLQIMVLEDDPITYLEKFLKDD